jgi:hypothetical protein
VSRKPYSRDGRTITEKGYVRLTRGEFRMKYEHRAVAIRLAREFFYYGPVNGDLPPGWTVHHVDWNKQHNCPSNLILMAIDFHNAAGNLHHRRQERDERGRWLPSWVMDDGVHGSGEDAWGEGRE